MNHQAIARAYPNAATIDDGEGVKDADGNQIEINNDHFYLESRQP
jgi:hypothetical protein